ncbi:DNA replication and repair protein RecF [Alicyclobacillus cellulosilyticus]|uniref:DNA replication and repair protein RecF n=1 Tax=Alicyclobacillus cellulosilyticus TaxID=1003997 RepID=A0A917K019_9BACL|nr:DNA replication/repair protein RecF [Alicyclobacillus cellulosilyticus]GGI95015.1 DNA replication and repair protein RecF [Alicyclobacillus cellulosilyticus]
MVLREIEMVDFRNYASQRIELAEGVNVLLGQNGQGKTNAIEAMYVLAMGKSHRTVRDPDLIRRGTSSARVEGVVDRRGRLHQLSLTIGPHGKRALHNAVPVQKMSEFIGCLQAVLFSPEDMQLVHGGPGVRRRFLDMEIGQMQPAYLFHLSRYQRALQQRNALLKQPHVTREDVLAFETQIIDHGAEVVVRRLRFIRHLREIASRVYEIISAGRERFDIGYVWSAGGEAPPPDDKPAVHSAIAAALDARWGADRQLGHTSVGPHRDDLLLYLDGEPAQAFASQGQQRTIALALRLAEIDLLREETGDYPVLLLDDVLSELDDARQRNLVLSMSERVQTVITATSLFGLADRLPQPARLFHVDSGIIQMEG